MMKHTSRWVLFCPIAMVLLSSLQANPITLHFFTEIQFADSNSDEWTIELQVDPYFVDVMILNGWYLTSSTDTAYFNQGIMIDNGGFTLIREDSLQSLFPLSMSGDTLTLYDSTDQWMDEVRYGNVDYAQISFPISGQSICLGRGDFSDYWYIDNTPTLGEENDLEGSTGTVEGNVFDSGGNSIEGAWIIYGYSYYPTGDVDTLYAKSDNSGYYEFLGLSNLRRVFVTLDGFTDLDTIIQIWPDSTVQLDFVLMPETHAINFPLRIGNEWHYRTTSYPDEINPQYGEFIWRVDSDTTMDNGLTYYTVGEYTQSREKVYNYFLRLDQVKRIIYSFNPDNCTNNEREFFNLNYIEDDAYIWNTCDGYGEPWGSEYINTVDYLSDSTIQLTQSSDRLFHDEWVMIDSIGLQYHQFYEAGPPISFDIIGWIIDGNVHGTLVSIEPVVRTPLQFILHSVYPNPFNPSTTIEYELPELSDVSLVIYDISGREVTTLVNQSTNPGSYKTRWNGMDKHGKQVSTGVYFARLQTGDYSSVVKMVYLR